MNRKLNLAKIAGKNVAKSVKSPVKNTLTAQSATDSPYFSPISHRTRNYKKEVSKDAKATVSGTQLLSGGITSSSTAQSVIKIEKNLSPEKASARKHIKVEYDENKMPTNVDAMEIKQEVKDELNVEQKPMKQAKKRSSGGKSAEATAKNIKIEGDVKTEDDSSGSAASDEKQAKWEPKNWRQLLANIREMRKERNAPVDTMGCEKCPDEYSDEKTKRFHHLISLMLSSQTKDGVTFEAMGRLKSFGLTPQKMVEVSTSELEQLIYPVGFYKTKAKHIQKTSQILIEKFDSDIPNDIKGLVSLPGVGPKMAHICMRVAWNIITGIGVDTHVHRISNRLKWVEKETKDPEQTRIALEKWLPFENWSDVNELLVGFGQTICTPTYPKCSECLNAKICPASTVKHKKS